jgi:hypothetical protein
MDKQGFTNGRLRIATEDDVQTNWGSHGIGRAFRCCLCGHKFKVGDVWRWVYTNSSYLKGVKGNAFICQGCDMSDEAIIQALHVRYEVLMDEEFWWFRMQWGIEE